MSIQSVYTHTIESVEQLLKEHEQKVAELKKLLRTVTKSSAKKEAEEGSEQGAEEVKASKGPSAWNMLVTQTVADMKQSGWPSWTDFHDTVWPASRSAMVKDKSGSERSAFVFDGGPHDGKEPSPALGGMKRASFLKVQSSGPAVVEKVKVRMAALAEEQASKPESIANPEAQATKKCISCKHEVALSAFQKSMTSTGAIRELKCCAECRGKQSKRSAIYNPINNPINNQKTAAARKAKKDADRESLASMSEGMPEGWAELLGSKVVTE